MVIMERLECYTAKKRPFQAAVSVTGHDNEIHGMIPGEVDNGLRGIPFQDFRTDFAAFFVRSSDSIASRYF